MELIATFYYPANLFIGIKPIYFLFMNFIILGKSYFELNLPLYLELSNKKNKLNLNNLIPLKQMIMIILVLHLKPEPIIYYF